MSYQTERKLSKTMRVISKGMRKPLEKAPTGSKLKIRSLIRIKTTMDQNIVNRFKHINSLKHLKTFHWSSLENVRAAILF